MEERVIVGEDGKVWGCSDPHAVTSCNGHDCRPPRRLIAESVYSIGGPFEPPMRVATRPQDWTPEARAFIFRQFEMRRESDA